MTWEEFKSGLRAVGLSQRKFAEMIEADPTTINKWRLQPAVPGYAAVIVGLMMKMKGLRDA